MGAAAIATGGIAGLQLLQANQQAKAAKRQADLEARQLEFNALLLDEEKKDVEKRAANDIEYRQKQVNSMLGTQKVSLAAQGIDVNSEVAQLLERDERSFGQQDVQTIKNNAWKESLGLSLRQQDLRQQATYTKIAGKAQKQQILTQGILGAAGTGVQAFGHYKAGQAASSGSTNSTGKVATGGASQASRYK